ncbi:MAG: hypothetical protein NC432_14495 [Roseburia sp.]|nr:hypothetical protein [Roseburia sp.]MCM1096814.1 hypothetical protein [Ruminococcus flavefaciens]
MKSEMLLDAMGKIDDAYIAAALKRLSEGGREHRHIFLRKVLPAAAAILILLVSSFGVAMAANEDFRDSVLRFFRLSQADVVLQTEDEPEQSEPVEEIGSTNTGGAVEAEYVRIDGPFDYNNGIIYRYGDWEGYGESGAQPVYALAAYEVKGGELLLLEPQYAQFRYAWEEDLYEIAFDWYEKDGMVYSNAKDYDPETALAWGILTAEEPSEYVAVLLQRGWQIDHEVRPLLYNLRTGELSEPLDGYGVLEDRRIREISFSPDLTGLLIVDDTDETWYCDSATHTLRNVCEMSGLDVWNAGFIDNDTVYCVAYDENGGCVCRTVSLSGGVTSGDLAELPEWSWPPSGDVWFTGGRYVLSVGNGGEVTVCDLKTGEQAAIEDFQCSSTEDFISANRAGNKILYAQADGDAVGLAVSRIGVLDLEKKAFILFDREEYETRYEASLGWFDDDRVAIRAQGEEYGYLYLLTVREPDGIE